MITIIDKDNPPQVSINYTLERGLSPWHENAFPDELKDYAPDKTTPRREGWFVVDWCGNQIGFILDGVKLCPLEEKEMFKRKIETINENTTIYVLDGPGAGGACHEYKITPLSGKNTVHIHFQNGPIQENGVNGVQQEDLLIVVIDRLESFQKGQFACKENEIALIKCQEALMWLNKRTQDRKSRQVEGTNKI